MSQNTIVDQLGTNLSIKTLVELARVSETAELYKDMFEFMCRCAQQKFQENQDLDVDERNLLSVSIKNIVGAIRASIRTIMGVDDIKENDDSYLNLIKSELKSYCDKYIELLTKYLLPTVTGNSDETEVFYLKSLGDYHRYLAEYFDTDKSYKIDAEKYYQQAMKIAMENLNETHPTRLGLALNFSVFYYEIAKEPEKACDLAKHAFDSSIEKLDTLNDASYKDSTLIMQLVRDNLTLWTGGEEMGAGPVDDDTIGFAVGGARDVNNFRERIENGIMPKPGAITYNGLLYEYYFDTKKRQNAAQNNAKSPYPTPKEETKSADTKDDGSQLFYPSYCYAKVNKLDFIEVDDDTKEQNEYYMTVGLNSNIKQKDFKRKALNLCIVLDKSGSMTDCFDDERSAYHAQISGMGGGGSIAKRVKTKMEVANECIVGLLKHLTPKDRFGLIVFDNESAVRHEMKMIEDIDMEKMKADILSIQASGGTNFECGYKEAVKMYEDGDINNDEVYDNRIIFLTDAHPNHGRTDKTSLFGMVDTHANNKDNYIYTSFIGVGLDFNASLIQDITNTRGCNYYAVKSTDDFEQVMNADFNYMVSPLVFNVVLRLKSEGGGCCIEKVYGTSAASEEGMVKTGEITKINTLFPSKKSKVKGGTKGGIQLIKLKNNNENRKGFNVEIEVSFEDKYGRQYKNNQFVTFETDEEDENDMIESNNYYDNTGIRKGILLCKYAELMMDWMQYEQDNGDNNNTLRVNDKYKKLFKEFMVHFENEMKQLKDEDLQKELDLMSKLLVNDEQE